MRVTIIIDTDLLDSASKADPETLHAFLDDFESGNIDLSRPRTDYLINDEGKAWGSLRVEPAEPKEA